MATPAMHAEKYSYLNIILIGEYITFSHNIPARSSAMHSQTSYTISYLEEINSNFTSLIVPRLWNSCMHFPQLT